MAVMKKKTDKNITSVTHAKRLLRFLSKNKKKISSLLILTHDYPDPDALASAYALNFLVEKCYGISSRIVYSGVIGRTENRWMMNILKIPAHRLRPSDFKRYKNVALVDSQPEFENNAFPRYEHATIVIDQHASKGEKPNADFVAIDTECGATCVILAQALLLKRVEIPVRIATALAYGILSDTLNLYRASRHDVVDTYLGVLHSCDMRALARIQNPVRPRTFFMTLRKALQDAMMKRRLIVSHLGFVKNPDLVSQVADFLLTNKGINWSVCTGRYNGKIYVSLRAASPNAEAGEVLRDIFESKDEAGGRGTVAGGSFHIGLGAIEELWKEEEQALIQRLTKRLRIPAKGQFYFPFR
ncbi:MAG: hypothetical protein COV74_04230 [Candidatus Omnitrophica bacterium CG11_big_fil_rev_8_21_14_0_20_45_26]|uniref:Uncharacterized protein n=1 Tax=Candidatus Abzuiibacterium crystallinum TaxID=1974748 RepID=A0A2H0LQA0_9BACT|nr:MAG: hypothetical protein COV74_04230 [Candidatus Omnitrophica bacterium CG11_big_fil_rev_8_21_14_0_20_45_26]PIW63980.1 MAG: hypothetical protein COW12_08750 [Candidatus Omnitrophica bacterium CG12_big_fil_rev_8_21_14_0_65_45_16]